MRKGQAHAHELAGRLGTQVPRPNFQNWPVVCPRGRENETQKPAQGPKAAKPAHHPKRSPAQKPQQLTQKAWPPSGSGH